MHFWKTGQRMVARFSLGHSIGSTVFFLFNICKENYYNNKSVNNRVFIIKVKDRLVMRGAIVILSTLYNYI